MKLSFWHPRPNERWALRMVFVFSVAVAMLLAADVFIFQKWMEPRGGDLRPQTHVVIYHRGGEITQDDSLTPVLMRGDRAVVTVPLPRELSRLQGVLAFTAEHVCFRASWEGRVLDRYGMGDVAPYKLFGAVRRTVPIPENAWGGEITIDMTAMQDGAHVFLAPMYLMDAKTSWQYPLENNVLCFLLFLSALVVLVAALFPLALGSHIPFLRRGLALALFSIAFIVWMMGYQGLMPLFSPDPYLNACVEYGALLLLPIPFITYLLLVEVDAGRALFYSTSRVWFIGLFLFAAFSQVTGLCTLKAVLPYLHATLLAFVIVLVWHKFHPLHKEEPWNILFRYGLTATFAAALLGMFPYYLFNVFKIPVSFIANRFIASGLLILLLTIIFTYIYRLLGQLAQAQESRLYKRMALQDMLTGLLSRAGCFDAAKNLAFDAHYAVLFFDVNGLKEANDLFGHAEGDKLLKATAEIIGDIFSPATTGTICARVGGDEFVVVVRAEKIPYLPQLIKAVRDELHRLAGQDGFPEDTSISCGISENDPANPKAFEEHIKIADDRMYAEKNRYKREKYGGRRASDRIFLREEQRKDSDK